MGVLPPHVSLEIQRMHFYLLKQTAREDSLSYCKIDIKYYYLLIPHVSRLPWLR